MGAPRDIVTVMHVEPGESRSRVQFRRKDGLVAWSHPTTLVRGKDTRVLAKMEHSSPLLATVPIVDLQWEEVPAEWDPAGAIISLAGLTLKNGHASILLRFDEPTKPLEIAKVCAAAVPSVPGLGSDDT
jgi:hypothetical protein